MKLKDKKIFLVEDNVTNLAVMMTILQQAGAKVHVDRWGKHTVAAIQGSGSIDMILMDLHLPRGVTGYDVFAEIQQHKNLRHIPVVVVSASEPAIEIPKAQKLGFAGYISKPIDYRTFASYLARIFDGEKIWADNYDFTY